jgi:hypothetical protein
VNRATIACTLFALSCATTPPLPDAARVRTLLASGACDEAFALAEAGAEQGDVASQTLLGRMYFEGPNVERDYTRARHWLEKAATSGDPEALHWMGILYSWGAGVAADQRQAVHWWTQAAKSGLPSAQFDLGVRYLTGRGATPNYELAVRLLDSASRQGHDAARKRLDRLHTVGPGGPHFDPRFELLRDAASADDAEAQWRLAHVFFNGRSLPDNRARGTYWLEKAASNGHAEAARYLKAHADDLKTELQRLCEQHG